MKSTYKKKKTEAKTIFTLILLTVTIYSICLGIYLNNNQEKLIIESANKNYNEAVKNHEKLLIEDDYIEKKVTKHNKYYFYLECMCFISSESGSTIDYFFKDLSDEEIEQLYEAGKNIEYPFKKIEIDN